MSLLLVSLNTYLILFCLCLFRKPCRHIFQLPISKYRRFPLYVPYFPYRLYPHRDKNDIACIGHSLIQEVQPQQSFGYFINALLSPSFFIRLPGHTIQHFPQPIHLLLSIIMLICSAPFHKVTKYNFYFTVFKT